MTNLRLRSAILPLLFAFAASAGCGERPEAQAFETFLASRQALAAGDVAAFKTHLAREQAAELDSPHAEMALELARSVMPQDIRLLSASSGGNEVTLTLSGRNVMEDGDGKLAVPAEGTVLMLREDGAWRVAKEDWSMQLDLAVPIFDVRPFMREGQRPVALKVLEGHASGATEILHTPNWKFLISASYGDYSLRVWEAATGTEVDMRTLEGRPTSLALDESGAALYVGTAEGDVVRWPLDELGRLGEPELLLEDAGRHVSVSPDGALLAATSPGEPVVVHALAAGTAPRVLAGSEELRSTTFSPSGELVVGSEGNELVIWNTRGWGQRTYSLGDVSPDSSNQPIAFSPDGRYLGVPCGDSSIIVFDVEGRRVKHDFFVSGAAAKAIQFSPDGSLFATAQNNQQINLWSLEDHRRVGYILAKKANATALRFSPDGRHLIAGHEDRDIVFWGVASDTEKAIAMGGPPRDTGLPRPPPAGRPERVELLSKVNYLTNPSADRHQQFWRASGETAVEECGAGDPCFVTRWDGRLVGTAELPPGSTGKTMLLIGSAAAERAHEADTDQTGESYIHGYGESLDPALVRGEHYSAPTLQTATRHPNQWATLWGVFEVGDGIRKISFEIRQSDGSSAKDGSASRFDDLGVYLFESEAAAQDFVARYEREVGHVTARRAAKAVVQAGAPPSQPPASLAPAEPASPAGRQGRAGSAMTQCEIDGRLVFTTASRCAHALGR
jgi:WD40 repeat protein